MALTVFPTIFSSLPSLPHPLVLPGIQLCRYASFHSSNTFPSCRTAYLLFLLPTTLFTELRLLPTQLSVHLSLLGDPAWFPGEVRSSVL